MRISSHEDWGKLNPVEKELVVVVAVVEDHTLPTSPKWGSRLADS